MSRHVSPNLVINIVTKVSILMGLVALGGCASPRMSDHESDNLFRMGKYDEAAERLKKGLTQQGANGRDTLLYLLDVGLSLHSSGKFEESNYYFLKANDVAEIKDYTSISTEAATLVTTENIKDYKGEDFEKVLISVYLAMNYALMGNNEDALVEARRVNSKLSLMVTLGQKKYKQNAFARYLSAVLYEADHSYDDSYIDYKNTYALAPQFPGLAKDLWRLASFVRNFEDRTRWEKEFHFSSQDIRELKATIKSPVSEIVVLYENGISPLKQPNPHFRELPTFIPRSNPVRTAEVEIDGEKRGLTGLLEDIERTAIENLDEKYSGLIAKKIAGLVVKDTIAYGIARQTHSPVLGLLAQVTLFASDQADLRSWNLLPRDLQVLRIPVSAGTHHVKIVPLGRQALPEKTIQVPEGKKVFVNFRYMP